MRNKRHAELLTRLVEHARYEVLPTPSTEETVLAHLPRDRVITVTASERRSQLRNREIALAKLADLVAGGLAPEPARRRATKPTRGSNRRRLVAKEQRSATKRQRQRPSAE